MTWQLYSSPRSPFARKVRIAAHELGLADRFEEIEAVVMPMAPDETLVKVNPLSMLPSLVVDGTLIYDSYVIMEFLNDAAEGTLFAADAPSKTELGTRHAMSNSMLEKAVQILDEKFRTANADTRSHEAGYSAAIRRGLAWMEPKLNSERFDAADITHYTLIGYLLYRFPDMLFLEDRAKSLAWFEAHSDRPSAIATDYSLSGNI